MIIRPMAFIYFILYTHVHYLSYITLFHYSGCYHIYLKLMVNIILKKNIGSHYLKKPQRKYHLQSNP